MSAPRLGASTFATLTDEALYNAMRGVRRILILLASVAVAFAAALFLLRRERTVEPAPASTEASRGQHRPNLPIPADRPRQPVQLQSPAAISFTDLAHASGVDFVSFTGTTADRHFPTANGTGVAMLDFDQDGTLDLYLVNATRLDGPSAQHPNALFRNHSDMTFDSVSEASRTNVAGFTQGVAVSDYNNDGFPDVYLVRYGPDVLLQNLGDGTFRDSTPGAGLDTSRWGTSAAFLDYDEDGNLDLYVANYGQWDMKWHNDHFCGRERPMVRIYCSPKILTAEKHCLYRSNGDGTFSDMTSEAGIARTDGRGQGVVAVDVNNDGHTDLYVANDLSPNFLFINQGNGRFQDHTELSCAAYNAEGKAEAGMGVDAADLDGDGLPELFVTNFFLEHNTLYKNHGNCLFQDVSHWSGVAAGSIQAVGWGTALEDLDGDGWLDVFVTNGHVDDNAKDMGRDEPYAQPPGLWRNVGAGKFEIVGEAAGPYFRSPHVGRGAAFGDLDNDGAIDIVVTHKDAPVALLHNESAQQSGVANSWTRLSLVGTRSSRDAIGARVEVVAGDRRLMRHLRGGKSYLSAHDLRLTIGLAGAKHIERVTVYWPSGETTTLDDLDVSRSYTVREPGMGSGTSNFNHRRRESFEEPK